MRGNSREIQRQMIEDEIIVVIDRKRETKITPKKKSGFIPMFDFLMYYQPEVVPKLGQMFLNQET